MVKKTRLHETLTNANFVKYLQSIFLTTSVHCRTKNLELTENILFMNVKKNNKLFCRRKKTFSVFEGALLNTLKLFSSKFYDIFFKHPKKNSSSSINSRFKTEKSLDVITTR